MFHSLIHKRYATALLSIATEQGITQRIYEDMLSFHAVCEQNKPLRQILRSPIIKTAQKKDIVQSLFSSQLHCLSIEFLFLLMRQRREQHAEDISRTFCDMYLASISILLVEVATASGLDNDLQQQIVQSLKTYSGKDILLSEVQNPTLLGGFRIRFAGLQYDATVLSELQKLSKTISSSIKA